MQCPIDNVSLITTERGGIEIEYCPACFGIWLDRGELDKLITIESAQDALRALSDFERPTQPHGKELSHQRKGFLQELLGF